MSDKYEQQVNVRLSDEYLKEIKRRGNRSAVIRKALDLLFGHRVVTLESIDSKLDKVLEALGETKEKADE